MILLLAIMGLTVYTLLIITIIDDVLVKPLRKDLFNLKMRETDKKMKEIDEMFNHNKKEDE